MARPTPVPPYYFDKERRFDPSNYVDPASVIAGKDKVRFIALGDAQTVTLQAPTTEPTTEPTEPTTEPTEPTTEPTNTATTTEPTAALADSELYVGEKISISGKGFLPGEKLAFELHSTLVELGTVIANADGTFSFETAVPAGRLPGDHSVYVLRENGNSIVLALSVLADDASVVTTPDATGTGTGSVPAHQVTVLAGNGDSAPAPALANTGANGVIGASAAALLAMAAGAGALAVRNRTH